MLIAKEKRKSNIAEYLIYMYQVEDLIRACRFESTLIEKQIILQYQNTQDQIDEIRNWYLGLADLMQEEKLQQKGHLNFIYNLFNELHDFHNYLMQNDDYANYHRIYQKNALSLSQLRQKFPDVDNEIQLMVDAIYGIFVLKLKKQPLSEDTLQSVQYFAGLLSELSKYFCNYEKGALKIE
jgi:hypothetical protein